MEKKKGKVFIVVLVIPREGVIAWLRKTKRTDMGLT
jgi:hypothetical protein